MTVKDPWREEIGFIPHLPGTVEAINADSFDEDVLESPVPVLVEFWAARCGPCRRLAPEFAAVAAAMPERLRVFTLNVDEELPAAVRYGILSIPATLLFVNGEERVRHIGNVTRTELWEMVTPFVGALSDANENNQE